MKGTSTKPPEPPVIPAGISPASVVVTADSSLSQVPNPPMNDDNGFKCNLHPTISQYIDMGLI